MSLDRTTEAALATRERLLDVARTMIETSGWTSITMAKVAAGAGVSRQTVHNAFGSKHGLAEELARQELVRFLMAVRQRFDEADDLTLAIRAACQVCLELAEESVLVRTILGTVGENADLEFLMLMTTESGRIVEIAVGAIRETVREKFPELPFNDRAVDVSVESMVRLVMSHIMRPSKPPVEAAKDIDWLIRMALSGLRD